jgi:hypothetical protein
MCPGSIARPFEMTPNRLQHGPPTQLLELSPGEDIESEIGDVDKIMIAINIMTFFVK